MDPSLISVHAGVKMSSKHQDAIDDREKKERKAAAESRAEAARKASEPKKKVGRPRLHPAAPDTTTTGEAANVGNRKPGRPIGFGKRTGGEEEDNVCTDSKKRKTWWAAVEKKLIISTAISIDSDSAAVNFFQLHHPGLYPTLNPSMVLRWRKDNDQEAPELIEKEEEDVIKRGCPKILSSATYQAVVDYIEGQISSGITQSPSLLQPTILAVIKELQPDCLEENGGVFKCSVSWVKKQFKALKSEMRKATSPQTLPACARA